MILRFYEMDKRKIRNRSSNKLQELSLLAAFELPLVSVGLGRLTPRMGTFSFPDDDYRPNRCIDWSLASGERQTPRGHLFS